MSTHKDEDVRVEYGNDAPSGNFHISEPGTSESQSQVKELMVSMHKTTIAADNSSGGNSHTSQEAASGGAKIIQEEKRQQRCATCNAIVGEAKQYRDHFKSDWHKHNLKRKLKQLPPLSAEECLADTELIEVQNDIHDYSR